MKTRVLVTGANGQLGKTIEELYSKNNIGLEFTFVTRTDLDIVNKTGLTSYFEKFNFDYCINCAAYTNVEQAEKTPEIAFKVNAEGVKYLAQSCKENNIILLHVSTDYVFDGEKKTPYTTEDIPNPINEYGKSKLLGECYIQEILLEYFIVRTSWVYSKKHGNNFYKTIKSLAEAKDELSITSDQTGCPTDTVNLSDYLVNLILEKSTLYGVHHFTDGNPMTWYDFAKQILRENNMINMVALVKGNNYRTFAKRPNYSVLKINSKKNVF